MKVLKTILLILSNILSVACGSFAAFGAVYFTLPAFKTTQVGLFIGQALSETTMFWLTLVAAVLYIVLYIVQKIFSNNLPAKLKNLFIHLTTWIVCLVGVALALYTFAICNPLITSEIEISIPKKITIGISTIFLILFHIFSGKLMTILNRKVQAYDTAKEMNEVGRSSIIWINFLKLFEIFFPEMLVLLILSMCASWNVSSYFVVLLVACIIPCLGNIDADFNTRIEIKNKKLKQQDELAQKIADIKGE